MRSDPRPKHFGDGAPAYLRETLCFVVMPFRPELNYFFLFVKRYLEENYRIRVERGDSNVLTRVWLQKRESVST